MYCSKIIQHAPVYHRSSWLILFIHIPCVIVGLVRVGRSWYSPQPSMKDLLIYDSSTPCLKTVTCLHIPECLLDGVLATVLLKDEVWPRQGLRQEEHTRYGNVTRAGDIVQVGSAQSVDHFRYTTVLRQRMFLAATALKSCFY